MPPLPPEALPERLEGKTSVLIIGSGMCGLLTACRLVEKGVTDICVVDADELCAGATSHTTAKITAQHELIYDKLLRGLGREKAWLYAHIHQDAVEEYAALAGRLGADCEFHRCSSVLYAAHSDNRRKLEQERDACLRLGLPVVMEKQTELPFAVAGSLWLADQACFHPLKFVGSLLVWLAEQGVRFYPHAEALHPKDGWRDGLVHTSRGEVKADTVVVTTRFPFMDKPGFYFARIWQERSYVLALKNVPAMEHMYLGVDEPAYSFRPWSQGILLGGGSHKAGHEGKRRHFEELEAASGVWYPHRETAARWSAQDCMTHDGVPYIGRYRQAEGSLSSRG